MPQTATGHRIPAILGLFAMVICIEGCTSAGRPIDHAGTSLVLIQNGRPNAAIVLGEQPSAQAKEAASELRAFLKRIAGVELPMADHTTALPIRVYVGRSAAEAPATALGLGIPTGFSPDFSDEGYVVATGRDCLILAGNETGPYDGTCFAVHDFLHTQGCRWYFPGEFGEVIPSRSTVTVEPTRRTVKPQFRVRDAWYSGYYPPTKEQARDFEEWKRRNRYCRRGFWGSSEYLGNPYDDSTHRLLPKNTYWQAHPEYYSLNEDGSRNDRFLCMSNPGAIAAAAHTITSDFKRHPHFHSFVFSPPDSPVLCHCSACQAAMHGGYDGEGYGAISDAYFRFVFNLADRVRQTDPDKYIITMAYHNRCRPPEGIDGRRSNLLIQIASIQQCTVHSYASRDCPTRHVFLTMLKRWAELAAGVVIYEYDPRDWSSLQLPLWRSFQMANDMRLLRQLGGWGVSVEGKMDWLSSGLGYYLRGRLCWDLAVDPASEEIDFCKRFFGPAAGPMLNYYRTISKSLWNSPVHVILQDSIDSIWPRAVLNQCRAMLEHAAQLASEEPYRTRVAAFRGQFDRIDAYSRLRGALAGADYRQAADHAQEMTDAADRVNNTMLLQDAQQIEGDLSGARQKAKCLELGKWIDGPNGKLLAPLPANALFRADAASLGVIERWYLPDADLNAWQPISMTTTWWNHGVVGPNGKSYQGIAWYRCDVALPEALPSRIAMYFPELKSSGVWVWCNGRLAGATIPDKTRQAVSVDLAGGLRPGRNTIVIRAKSDIGITLPPFLFEPQPDKSASTQASSTSQPGKGCTSHPADQETP